MIVWTVGIVMAALVAAVVVLMVRSRRTRIERVHVGPTRRSPSQPAYHAPRGTSASSRPARGTARNDDDGLLPAIAVGAILFSGDSHGSSSDHAGSSHDSGGDSDPGGSSGGDVGGGDFSTGGDF